MINEKSDTS